MVGSAAIVSFAFFGGDMRPPQIALAIDGKVERLARAPKRDIDRLEIPINLKSVLHDDDADNEQPKQAPGVTLAAAPALRDRVTGEEPYSIDTEDNLITAAPNDVGTYSGGPEEIVILVDGAPAKSIPSSVDALQGVTHAQPVTLASIDPSLLRKSPFGAIPKISTDGRKPINIYARPFKLAQDGNIALIIGGLGLNKAVTERAIDDLPSEVTLAFAPYAKDLDYWAKRARDAGHEVMLELPMEHRSGDQSALGPAALLTTRTTDENLQRLDWLLSRFEGYFGVTNYLGSRFASDEKAITAVLTKIQGAGLAYVDDTGSVRRFGKMEERGITTVNRIIEQGYQDSKETARDLKALEDIAIAQGGSLGKTYASASTIDEIAGWASGLSDRKLTLAPASAVLALRRGES